VKLVVPVTATVEAALPIENAVALEDAALLLPSAVTDAVAVYVPAPVGAVLPGP
jgi:hypothetical protein